MTSDVEKIPGPIAEQGFPLSEAVRIGSTLMLSGQIAMEGNRLVEGGIAAETEFILDSIEATLERQGLAMDDIVKCTVFITDMADWPKFNEIYRQRFTAPYPARSVVGVKELALGARVEVECVASCSE